MRTYRSSSLGSCTRAQIALQLGMAALGPSDKMAALYQRGHDHEAECLVAMAQDGWKIVQEYEGYETHDGQVYAEIEVAGAKVTTHLDGIALGDHNGADRVVEIKSPISWAKWERAHKTGDYSDPLMNRYAWQGSAQMVATGLEMVVACVEDGQVRTFGIETPPFDLEAIGERVAYMEMMVRGGDVPDDCSQQDFPCPVAYLHDKAEVVDDPELFHMQTNYVALKAQKDEAEAGMKAIREKMDAHLGLSDSITTAVGTVTRYTSTRTTYDTKAAIADGIDLSAYAKTTSSTSVKVTPKESE